MKRVYYIYITISFFALFITSCDKTVEPEDKTGTIQGKVTNIAGDTLIAGAIVTTTPSTSIDTTDDLGNFSFTHIPVGAYTIKVSKSGYNDGNMSVTVKTNETVTANISIAKIISSLLDGLVAYFPFSGNTNDESGNGNHGTNSGATLTTDRFGDSNKAYSFNGTNSKITVSNSSLLNPSNNLTLSAWVNFSSLTNTSSILGKGADSQVGWYSLRYEKTSQKIWFQINFTDYPQNGRTNLNANSNIMTNNWYHIVGVYDGTLMKIYVNGKLDITKSVVKTLNSNLAELIIGSSPENYLLNGKLDDIRIYNYALNNTQIDSLYHLGGWNPQVNNELIVFTYKLSNQSDIWKINPDGTGAAALINWSNSNEDVPVLSPDGSKIAFISNKSGSAQIWVANSNGTNPLQITNSNSFHSGIGWSPDGQYIYYSVNISSTNTDIYKIKIDGTGLTPLRNGTTYEYAPSVDPVQGRYMLYKYDSGAWGPTALSKRYDMQTNSEVTIIDCTDQNKYGCHELKYSPDASKITFSRDIGNGYASYGGPCNIYIMNADGTNWVKLTNLTGSGQFYKNPSWSPDGSKLVFSYNNQSVGVDYLLLINSDGGGNITQLNITYGGVASSPFWGKIN